MVETTRNSPRIGAAALRAVASQIRHRLSDMELRSNVSWPASTPSAKTSGYVISEVPDWQLRQWLHIVENVESALSANPLSHAEAKQPALSTGPTPPTPLGVGPTSIEGASK